MTYEVNGKVLETTETGYLVSQEDWDGTWRRPSPPRRDSPSPRTTGT